MKCSLCKDCGWVCEDHPDQPVGRPSRLPVRCRRRALPVCNIPEDGASPRLPDGFKTEIGKDGWRH